MPIYEYKCKACEIIHEVMQKISDPAPSTCPECGKGPMEKQMSMTSFSLKGTGWYVTDFRGGQNKASPSGSASSQKSDSDSNTSKSEAKSESSADAKGTSKTDTASDTTAKPSQPAT